MSMKRAAMKGSMQSFEIGAAMLNFSNNSVLKAYLAPYLARDIFSQDETSEVVAE